MPKDSSPKDGLWDELKEAYDVYEFHSYTEDPPDRPLFDHWKAKGERAALVYLGMPVLPILLFRVRNYLRRHDVPLLPYLCDRLSTITWQVTLGRYVDIGPGLYIAHGQVVIDGKVTIGRNCVLSPWVTIGLSGRRRNVYDARGPVIGDRVFIGTGAKVLGPITVGDDARIGANTVVIDDVPSGATVVGSPARVVYLAQPPGKEQAS